MRSAAHFRGHPIHPSLIPFPFAFLTGAFVANLVARLNQNPTWSATGRILAIAGILTALLAAIPGFIDYFRSVPPQSSGKRRATLHMGLNLGVVVVFLIATWLGDHRPDLATLAVILEGLATVALFVAGWHGGVLVSRNQISIDHRYAEAGKWSEVSVQAEGGKPVVVANVKDLQPGQMRLLRVNGKRLVLARTAEGYVCFDDHCTHKGGSLADGSLACGVVQCPWHGSQFDVKSGAVRAGPAKEGITTYAVEVKGKEVRVVI